MKSIAVFFVTLLTTISLNSLAQVITHFSNDTITANSLVASSFINDNVGWVEDNTGVLWHTSDGALTWTPISTGKIFVKLKFVNEVNGYAITSDSAFKTGDGGNTWTALTMPGKIGKAIFFLDTDKGFIGGPNVIYRTTDGGITWTTFSTDSASVVNFYFINSSLGVAAAFDDNAYQSIWRTTDGGASWSNVYSVEDYNINAIWFTGADTGWAAGYFESTSRGDFPIINRTTDGGLTWENVYMNQNPGDERGEQFLDIRFRNKKEGLAISSYSENVFTINGGLTWNLTYNKDQDLIPSYGVYKFLDGFHSMLIAGRKGYVTSWK